MNPAVLLIAGAGLLVVSRKPKRSKKGNSKTLEPCPVLNPSGGQVAGFDYNEFTTGGADPSEQLPLIVFFHSMGSSPETLAKFIQGLPHRARVVMPRGHEGTQKNPKWWTLRAGSDDQEGLAQQMGYTSAQMVPFVELIARCRPTYGRPIVTGHSQGGMMTFAVAAQSPDFVRAAVPASGWLPQSLWPQRLPTTIAVHGTLDRTVNYARTADFLAQAKGAGIDVTMIPIEDHKHGLSGSLKQTWLDSIDWAMQNTQ